MNIRISLISLIACAASAVAQTSNQSVMTLGNQTIYDTKTFDGLGVSGSGSFVTKPGAIIRIGNVALQWNGFDGTACIEADGNKHGLIVHTSGSQGNAIVAFSQSGAAGLKAWQETFATSPALIVGRSEIISTTGIAPLVLGIQSAGLSASLLKLTGAGTFEVLATGAPILGGSPPATASSPGVPGQVAWDADYFYLCTGTNQWKRAALSTWYQGLPPQQH